MCGGKCGEMVFLNTNDVKSRHLHQKSQIPASVKAVGFLF